MTAEKTTGVSEADGAFYSFAGVMLSLYLVPATLFTGFKLWRQPKKTFTARWFAINVVVLAVAGYALWRCMDNLQGVDMSGVFEPYEILQIPSGASVREIKKAFRRLSRDLHPDKNRGNERAAAARFGRVTKAYEALTDPIGIENYRKYGHPDGRQSMLLNFAIFSSFGGGGSGGNSALFVLGYFGVVFGVLAMVVYSLHKSSNRRDPTQVSRRTTAQFVDSLNDRMSLHDIVELLLSSDEMTTIRGDDDAVQAQERSKTHDKLIKKMEAAKALPGDVLTRIKKHPNPVARENMLALYQYLRRSKLAGVSRPLWVDVRLRKILLELPYLVEIFANIAVEHSIKRGYTASTLVRTLGLLPSIAQGSFVADAPALRDQLNRMTDDAALPEYKLEEVSAHVLDEPNVQPGDWLTLSATLVRNHVSPGESAPIATTFYDAVDPKSPFRKEHAWFTLIDKASNRLLAAWKCTDLGHRVTQKKGCFGPDIAGNYELELRVTCSPYLNCSASYPIRLKVETTDKSAVATRARSSTGSIALRAYCSRIPGSDEASARSCALPRVTHEDVVYENPWIRLKTIHFLDQRGNRRQWTGLERTTTYPRADPAVSTSGAEHRDRCDDRTVEEKCDAVVVFPFLTSAEADPRVILIRQYRPPVGKWVLELPAGLIDPDETPEQAATRELLEETGYHATRVLHIGPPMVNDQGITNGRCRLILMEVEADAQRNEGVRKQRLEADEMIQVVHAPLRGLIPWLMERKQSEGDALDARLYSYALGLEGLSAYLPVAAASVHRE
ncbi:TPA: hypothetical protein N0F65_010781 [Lagenidium giganteum]|uniref:Uncharacterized protein n=1 Tax=Lagenidium giganteum TaxID=4803 RepID=A0AAV2YVW0_9STRA|nr:TPA: hypothetical protein N0F65_010781 [Lagenidium giganteum]